jgi:hypothetical protein
MKRGPAIPARARNEISGIIQRNGRISSDELDAILKKHRVRGNVQALQRGYRLRAAQRLLAGVRDEEGQREILAWRDPDTGGAVYVPVDMCNDEDVLASIQNRLHKSIASMQISSGKAANRTKRLHWLKRPFVRMVRRK